MAEIISVEKLTALSKSLKVEGKKIVLAGGCFDILHPGHVIFLEKAKEIGDILIIFLESDQKVKELKGKSRPVYKQQERAKVLSALRVVDYVVMLPYMKLESEYDELVRRVNPQVIAVTSKDETFHHQRAAKFVGAKFQVVSEEVEDYSTSKIFKFLNEN